MCETFWLWFFLIEFFRLRDLARWLLFIWWQLFRKFLINLLNFLHFSFLFCYLDLLNWTIRFLRFISLRLIFFFLLFIINNFYCFFYNRIFLWISLFLLNRSLIFQTLKLCQGVLNNMFNNFSSFFFYFFLI